MLRLDFWLLVFCAGVATCRADTSECDPYNFVALTDRTSVVLMISTPSSGEHASDRHATVRSWPEDKLQQPIAGIADDEESQGYSMGTILQLAESETHMCLRFTGRTTCVLRQGLGKDEKTGQVRSKFGDDWLLPLQSARLSQVCNGDFFSCGVSAEGDAQVACWGLPMACNTGICSPPTLVGGFSRVSCGAYHACGVGARGGDVLCWGSNTDGAAAPPAGAFASVSAGSRHTCGVRVGGHVECWGSNEGVGDSESRLTW